MLRIEVVQAFPGKASIVRLELPDGATVRDALAAAGIEWQGQKLGVFGEQVAPDARVADGDRVEIYRPLEMDAREARRRRALKKR